MDTLALGKEGSASGGVRSIYKQSDQIDGRANNQARPNFLRKIYAATDAGLLVHFFQS
jgi:hypothetical protein